MDLSNSFLVGIRFMHSPLFDFECEITSHMRCRLSRDLYLNTEEFIDAVADELRAKLGFKA